MVMCEMLLNGIEEELIGIAHELRPALALGYPPVPANHGAHLSRPLPSQHLVRPAESVFG